MSNRRRKMNVVDWLNAAALAAVGLYLGLGIEKLLQLDGVAFWVVGIGALVMAGAIFLFEWVINGAFDWLFPNGIKPSRNPKPAEPRPFALLLSLPIGVIIGVVGAQFGLSDMLL